MNRLIALSYSPCKSGAGYCARYALPAGTVEIYAPGAHTLTAQLNA